LWNFCGEAAAGVVLFGRPTQPAAAVTWKGQVATAVVRLAGGRAAIDSRRYSGVSIAQIGWPFVTAAPGETAMSVTTPDLCATTSFSIFIASTMQIT
jgi:hypothetical protein